MKTKMKSNFLFAAVLCLTVTSCKYEEGPALSLRSKKARMAGEWKIEKVFLNGTDITPVISYPADFKWHVEKDGTYHVHGTGMEDGGTWKFADSKKELHTLSDVAGSEEEHYEILKLKNKELWLKHTHDNEVYEYHYKQ
jgi:hypothetical protein